MKLRRERATLFGFHFGFQPSITQRHLPAPTVTRKSAKRLYWVLLGDAGCKMWRTENPRVGGSIPPLATIKHGQKRPDRRGPKSA